MSAKFIIKVLTLGDSNVGKSSIVLRYFGKKFDERLLSTIGIDFKTKIIDFCGASIKLLVWDTAGQEKFKSITKRYYKGANGVLLVYDVTSMKSFEHLGYWLNELKSYEKFEEVYVVIIGNKIDNIRDRAVPFEEGEKFAKENNLKYFEVSAKTKDGIDCLFNDIIQGSTEKLFSQIEIDEKESNTNIFSFLNDSKNKENKPKNKKCC